MAESVQYYLERMIPELEGLEKKNIFSPVEIKSIIKKRTNFEYALHRRIKQKIDFLRAIEYEINLEELRKKRVSRMGITDSLKGNDLQYSGTRRIYNLFKRATTKFKNDLSLWLQYIDYARRHKSNNILSSVFVQAIQYHPHNASLWIMAATWENEENANIAAARVLMQRALRLMPENQQLWHEYFRLELLYIEKIKLRRRLLGIDQQKHAEDIEPTQEDEEDDNTLQLPALTGEDVAQWQQDEQNKKKKKMTEQEMAALEEANNPILQGLLAKIVYTNAIQAIPTDIEFRQRFIEIYREFTDTEAHVEHVYQTIQEDLTYPKAKSVLAKRHLTPNLTVSDPQFITALRACVADFEEAVANLNEPEMWQEYAEFVLSWQTMVSEENLKLYLTKLALKIFKACQKQHKLNGSLYQAWTELLLATGDRDKASMVVEHGLAAFPQQVRLWLGWIELADPEEQSAIYTKALVANPASLELWQSFLDWIKHHLSMTAEEKHEAFFQACSKATMLLPSVTSESAERNEIKQVVQSSYVTWAAETEGIASARTVYRKLIKSFYPTYALFMTCIELENQYGSPDQQGQTSVEFLYDHVTRMEHHKEETYLAYLAYLYSQKKFQKASQVYNRACKELPNREALDIQIQKLRSQ
ncbi:U3 small nucleolar RNA-associated protein 6-domain-containing protein [Blakeslea trispora]|nr:U3 small nucleolar RNA-associated protein 6-domain-containing protein [Blakeslea trispora]